MTNQDWYLSPTARMQSGLHSDDNPSSVHHAVGEALSPFFHLNTRATEKKLVLFVALSFTLFIRENRQRSRIRLQFSIGQHDQCQI